MADNDNHDSDRERFAQASRYIRQAVEEILQQSRVTPSSSAAATARMPPPAPVTSAPSAVQILASHDGNRPGEAGTNSTNSGLPESARRSASQELRDAFAPYSRHAYQFTRFGRGAATTASRGHSSSRRRSPFSSVSNNWTHRFCLVPFKDQVCVPTLSERDSWRRAGMGEKTLVFDKNGDHSHIAETICAAFEKLRAAGGFTLLRSGSRSTPGERTRLELISIPYGGYSVPFLKNDSPLRSAMCFIRPMQMDLPLDEIVTSSATSAAGRRMPMIECIQCGTMVEIDIMEDHIQENHPRQTSDTLMDYFQPIERHPEPSSVDNHDSSVVSIDTGLPAAVLSIQPLDEEVAEQREEVNNLREMFPTRPVSDIEEALSSSATLESAVDDLLTGDSGGPSNVNETVDEVDDPMADMEEYFEAKLTGLPQVLEVDRTNFWQLAFAFYKKICDHSRPFRVKFLGEEGIDAGGPRKEFFQLLANKIASIEVSLFEGNPSGLLPVMKGSALRLGHLKIAGKIIAHSIANGGVGFPFLAEPIYSYLVTESEEDSLPLCTIAMVSDTEARDIIQKIADVTDATEFDNLSSDPEVIDYSQRCGWTSLLSYNKRENLVATMLLFEIIWKRHTAINQLAEGLKKNDILTLIRKNPESLKEKFVASGVLITQEILLKEMIFTLPGNEIEERAKTFLIDYLNLNGQISAGNVKGILSREEQKTLENYVIIIKAEKIKGEKVKRDVSGNKFKKNCHDSSQYQTYLDYVREIGTECGFVIEQDIQRIPSTKRTCHIARKRSYLETEQHEIESKVQSLLAKRSCHLKLDDVTGVNAAERDRETCHTADSEHTQSTGNKFLPREAKDTVRNCTQINKDVKNSIIEKVTTALLKSEQRYEENHNSFTSKGRRCSNWNCGGSLPLAEVTSLLTKGTLQELKSQCGGLQTLLRNHGHIFKVVKGEVILRNYKNPEDHINRRSKKGGRTKPKSNYKTKLCWFHFNHPDGCILSDKECQFAHNELELRAA
eukprot:Seg752.11 transcript_id=Seg752.11/GoldUCD/mRNA.D3Y31 product="tRNA uracil-O 2-methyltransferase" protein_id=Seg752.11/GoldUCD/D3Y31